MTNTAAGVFRLEGKVVVVTGGAQGIGLATARLCRTLGTRVVLLDRDGAALAALADQAGEEGFSTYALDITQETEVAAAIDKIVQAQGRIDVLVNNAGIAIRDSAVQLSRTAWDQVMEVNVTGMFLCAREVARTMIGRGGKSAGGGGAIVNVSSIMGLSGGGVYPNVSYQTSKGAVVNLTRALAVEWAPHGIRVNAVAPTYVDTQFIKALTAQPEIVARIKAMTPLGRLAQVDEVAAAIAFLASPAAAMITGHTLPVDGGYLAQ